MLAITVQPYRVDPAKYYGSRFDYGFLRLAVEEGYSVQLLPIVDGKSLRGRAYTEAELDKITSAIAATLEAE